MSDQPSGRAPVVEYGIRCEDGGLWWPMFDEASARKQAKEWDATMLYTRPHRVIERTITERDITDV